MEKATNIRKKEKEDFDAASADMSTNIAAMKGAISALEKGLGAFMQMGASSKAVLLRAVAATTTLDDYQREGATAFLQGKESAQSSGEIMGMLKAMLEEMEGDLSTAKKDEAAAVAGFEELSAAKAAEIASATSAIESKTKRSGEVAVEVVQTKDDLEDTLAEAKETQAFLGDLGKQCAEKKADGASARRCALRRSRLSPRPSRCSTTTTPSTSSRRRCRRWCRLVISSCRRARARRLSPFARRPSLCRSCRRARCTRRSSAC